MPLLSTETMSELLYGSLVVAHKYKGPAVYMYVHVYDCALHIQVHVHVM